ncbi:MAG: hypothetical protein M3Q56_07035 [Bacteroidota bacterium]|nr:hypothetical protein [Bacteroidota bacterium]
MIKPIIKFALFFFLFYAFISLLISNQQFSTRYHSFFKSSLATVVGIILPSAHIETQDVLDEKGKLSLNRLYLVFGNPVVIEREINQARLNKLSEIKVSTFSRQFLVYEFFIVPILFLVSLFVATPMNWRRKILYLAVSLGILIIFLYSKASVFTLYAISESRIGIYELSNNTMQFLASLISALSLGFSVVLCLVIWLILGFKNSTFLYSFKAFFKSKQA